MALKKGSPAAKAWGRKMKRLRNATASPKRKKSTSTKTYKGGKIMAKRKTRKTTARRKPAQNNKIDLMMDVGLPTAYGYGRESLSDVLEPVLAKIPLGLVSDELIIGGLAYLGNKKIRNVKAKKALKNVVVIESSRVGTTAKDFGIKKTFTGA